MQENVNIKGFVEELIFELSRKGSHVWAWRLRCSRAVGAEVREVLEVFQDGVNCVHKQNGAGGSDALSEESKGSEFLFCRQWEAITGPSAKKLQDQFCIFKR